MLEDLDWDTIDAEVANKTWPLNKGFESKSKDFFGILYFVDERFKEYNVIKIYKKQL